MTYGNSETNTEAENTMYMYTKYKGMDGVYSSQLWTKNGLHFF